MYKWYKVISLIWLLLFSFSVSFAGLNRVSSWINKVEYQVKWCNPVFWCKTGYFSSNTVWPAISNWFVVSPSFKDLWIITSHQSSTPSSPAWLKDIFWTKQLKWEWVYTITVHVYDNVKYWKVRKCDSSYSNYYDWNAPWNCSTLQLVYKIDKTHPNIVNPLKSDSSYPEIDENSSKVYIWRSDKQTNVKDYDAVNNNENSWNEKLIRWSFSNIQDQPLSYIVSRKTLKTIYYSDQNQNITIKLNLANYFNDWNIVWNYDISPLDKIAFLDQNHNLKKTWSLNSYKKNEWIYEGSIKDIFWNNVNQKVFYFRLYDKAWNYSDTPVYVVKDTTPPITLNEFLNTFTFNDASKVFYTTNAIWPLNWTEHTIPSKFFQANTWEKIEFKIADTKNWNGNKWNAWLLKFKFRIENAWFCGNYDIYPLNTNLYQTRITSVSEDWFITHDFSQVDECWQDSHKTYRYYRASLISVDEDWNTYPNKICDKVWNCTQISPIVFRVVANKLDNNNSKVKIATNLTNNRMLANKQSNYILYFKLKDKYKNKILPVYSQEDNQNVKKVSLSADFKNGLYLNQIDKSWNYWTFKEDMENDDNGLATISSFSNNISFSENPQFSPDGIYKFKIYSLVPTFDYYPWEWNKSKLVLKKINFKAVEVWNNNIVKSLWIFNENKFKGTTGYISLNTWSMWYQDTINRYFTVNKDEYWKIDNNNYSTLDSFANKSQKKIKFSFASPVLVWLNKLKSLSEWVKNYYYYRIWNFDTGFITKNNIQLNESWKYNTFYDLFQWSDWYSEYKTDNISIEWTGILASPYKLDLINNFTGILKEIKKYTKLSIDPTLAAFYDKNNSNIALWTKLVYKNWWDTVILPSDGRWVSNNINEYWTNEYWDSLSMFDGTFSSTTMNNYNNWELSPLVQSIKILWNVQAKWRVWNISDIIKNRHISIWWDIHKWQVKNNVRKKISEITRGRKRHNWNVTTISNINSLPSESFKIGYETIVPINWNVDIWSLWIDRQLTIIVKDGSVYIKGNIHKTNNKWLLTIISIKTDWFKKNSVSFDNILNSPRDQKGFIYIDPSVTNIDAYMYTEWSILSYNWTKVFYGWNTLDTDLNIYNQLYIRWGVISTNTIGWSRLVDSSNVKFNQKCPWFLDTNDCNLNNAQAFDFIYLRRYMLVSGNYYGGPASYKLPYIPVSQASDISSYNLYHPYMWGKQYYKINNNSVSLKDDDTDLINASLNARQYPLYIEYDPVIQQEKSAIFKP